MSSQPIPLGEALTCVTLSVVLFTQEEGMITHFYGDTGLIGMEMLPESYFPLFRLA